MNNLVETLQELDTIKKRAIITVYQAQSVFPFDIVPNIVTLDLTKLTIRYNTIFASKIFPILISDIKNIIGMHGIFFSSIRLEIRGYEKNPPIITFMWPEDVERIRKYTLALIEVSKNRINLTKLSENEIMKKLDEIGQAIIDNEFT